MARKLDSEVVVERFKRVHGDLYDYSKVAYKGKDSKVQIGCAIHGDFFQSPHNHYKGQGCPVCGDLKQTRNTTYTKEQFVSMANETHKSKYNYDLVEYSKSNVNVTITCPTHGNFSMKPVNHLQGQGCARCYRERQSESQAYSTDVFVTKAKEVHGDLFDYSLTKYTRSVDKVKIVCKKHGVFDQEAASHLCGIGCPQCAVEIRSELKRKDTEHFLQVAKSIHGDRYDYSLVDYKDCKTPVMIICKEHGVFKQKPSGHYQYSGCPSCCKYGFDPNKGGYLYVLQYEDLVKVGITSRVPEKRLKEIKKDSGLPFKVVYSRRYEDGQECSDKETEILRKLRAEFKNPDTQFDGSCETFVGAPLAYVINMCASNTQSMEEECLMTT